MIEVSLKGGALFFKGANAKLRFLFIRDSLLGLAGFQERLGHVVASLEPAVVRTADLCVGMHFHLAALLPAFLGRSERALQFDPVNPDGGWESITVFILPSVVRIPKVL